MHEEVATGCVSRPGRRCRRGGSAALQERKRDASVMRSGLVKEDQSEREGLIMQVPQVCKTVVLGVAFSLASASTAFAVTQNIGGGVWDYGTNVFNGVGWSSYFHQSRDHGASLLIGADLKDGGCVKPRKTSKAVGWRPPLSKIQYFWRHC